MKPPNPKSFQCFYCDNWYPCHQMTRDHLYPKWTGIHGFRNIVPACSYCNQTKGARFPTDEELLKYKTRFRRKPPREPKLLGPPVSPLEKEFPAPLLKLLDIET